MKKLLQIASLSLITLSIFLMLTTTAVAQIPTANLVAHYSFAGDAADSSGNANHGTVYGATLSPDRFLSASRAYYFNGTSNYISVPNSTSLNFADSISISFWMKLDTLEGMMICKTSGGGYQIEMVNSQLRFSIGNVTHLAYDMTPYRNKWVHVVGTIKNNVRIELYINGFLVGYTTPSVAMATDTSKLYIGRASWVDQYYYKGFIDDIRIYRRVLTQNEVTALYHENGWYFSPYVLGEYKRDSNTRLLLHLNDISATTVNDVSGYMNNGTLSAANNPSRVTNGKFDAAKYFDGSHYINLPNDTTLKIQPITVEAWIKLNDTTSQNPVLYAGNISYALHINQASFQFKINTLTISTPQMLRQNKWYHIAATYSGSVIKLYVNGVNVTTYNYSAPINYSSSSYGFRIGYYPATGDYFKGMIDEVRISNIAREPNEFNLQLPPHSVTADLLYNGNRIELNWQNGGGNVPLMKYKIYLGKDSTNLALVDSTTTAPNITRTLPPGTYYTRVSAVDSTGFESFKSNMATKTIPLLQGEYANDNNTVLLMHLNDLYTNDICDASDHNNRGTATDTIFSVDSRFGASKRFSGTGSYITVPNHTSLSFGTLNFTVEAWVKTGYTPSNLLVISKYQTNGYALMLENGYPRAYVRDINGNTVSITATRTVGDNKWHHWAMVKTSTELKLYIDGVLENSVSTSTITNVSNAEPLYIGSVPNAPGFAGWVDEVRISKIARDPNTFNLQLPPVNLSSSFDNNIVTVIWQNGGGAVGLQYYHVYRGLDSTIASMNLQGTLTGTVYIDASVSSKYYYRVVAVDSTDFPSAFSYATVPPPPTAPSNLSATLVAPNQINLSWTDNSTNEELFIIERKENNSVFYQIATSTTNTYSDYSISTSTTYTYRVYAYNIFGSSDYSNTAGIATAPDAPNAIDPALNSGSIGANWFIASWSTVSGASGYLLDVSDTTTFTTLVTGYNNKDVANVTNYNVAGLDTNKWYYYRVRAYASGGGTSANSNSIAVYTTNGPKINHTPSGGDVMVMDGGVIIPSSYPIYASASDGYNIKNMYVEFKPFKRSMQQVYFSIYTGETRDIPGYVFADFNGKAAGVDYRIVAENMLGMKKSTPWYSINVSNQPNRAISCEAQIPAASQYQNASEMVKAYRIVSVPYILNDQSGSHLFRNLGEHSKDKTPYYYWRAQRLTNGGKEDFDAFRGNPNAVTPGAAFFLITRNSGQQIQVSGTRIFKTSDFIDFGVTIYGQNNGWFLLGNPIDADIPFDSLTFSEPVIDRAIYDNGWQKPFNVILKPWQGVAVKTNSTASSLNVKLKSGIVGSLGKIQATTMIPKVEAPLAQNEWQIPIEAFRADMNMLCADNAIGMRKDAKDGHDKYDSYTPPFLGDKNIAIAFDGEYGGMTKDIRTLNDNGGVWNMKIITGDAGAKVKLNFGNNISLPNPDFKIYFIDVKQQKAYNLKETPTLEVYSNDNGEKEFKIVVGKQDFVQQNSSGVSLVPNEIKLFANFPNPFNPSTRINYNLPSGNEQYFVTLKIYNILGQEVATLVNKMQTPGYQHAIWDAKNCSSGMYIYTLTVSDGQKTFRDTKKMVLLK